MMSTDAIAVIEAWTKRRFLRVRAEYDPQSAKWTLAVSRYNQGLSFDATAIASTLTEAVDSISSAIGHNQNFGGEV
jgi:hypothetical protein